MSAGLAVAGGGALVQPATAVPAAAPVLEKPTVLGTARAITVMATTAIPASLATTNLQRHRKWAASIAGGGLKASYGCCVRALGGGNIRGLLITAVVTCHVPLLPNIERLTLC